MFAGVRDATLTSINKAFAVVCDIARKQQPMAFTDDKKRIWYEGKRRLKTKSDIAFRATRATIRINYHNDFGIYKDMIRIEASSCDTCLGD